MHNLIHYETHFLQARLATHHVGEFGRGSHYHIFSVVVKVDLTSVGSILAISPKNIMHVIFEPEILLIGIYLTKIFMIYNISYKQGFTIVLLCMLI